MLQIFVDYFNNPERGILGIIILALGAVIVWEEKGKADLRKENKELANELQALAEKRVADLERIKDADFQFLDKIRAAENDKSDRIKEMVSSILSISQNLQSGIQTLFSMKGGK